MDHVHSAVLNILKCAIKLEFSSILAKDAGLDKDIVNKLKERSIEIRELYDYAHNSLYK